MSGRSAAGAVDSTAPPRWPPPGLERVQGDLFVVAARAALAGGLLVLPLLLLIVRDESFATPGPLADAWWISIALGTVGLAFALDALGRAARTLRRTGDAVGCGYALSTVGWVLVDAERDMGFLLAGGRHFSMVSAEERLAITRMRTLAALLLTGGGLWLLLSFGIGLLLASRGRIDALGLGLVTLGPAVLAYAVGGVGYLVAERRVRRARRRWHAQPWSEDVGLEEVRRWHRSLDPGFLIADAESSVKRGAHGRVLTAAGAVVGGCAVLVALPVLTLLPTSAVGSVLMTVSTPGFEAYRSRAARIEAYRSYAVDGDVSTTAQVAGGILQDLLFVGSGRAPDPGERPPSIRYDDPWIPDGSDEASPLALAPVAWGDSIFDRVEGGASPEVRAFLASVAQHPAADAFVRLAGATALDVGSARWSTPFPAGMTMATLPVPRFSRLRDAANARIAAAALSFLEGSPEEAERALSEVIAVGFLLGDEAPTLIDNLVGFSMVEAAGAALADLYRLSDRRADAAELSRLRDAADRSAAMASADPPQGHDAWVRSLPELVLDPSLVRGLRWEYLINLTTMAPCLNLNRMVFGADEAYESFFQEARAALARWPSEEALFELARYGWIGRQGGASNGPVGWVMSMYMRGGENSCARMVRHVQAGSLF